MKVKNLIENLKELNPEGNITFTLDLDNLEKTYSRIEIYKETETQIWGLIK